MLPLFKQYFIINATKITDSPVTYEQSKSILPIFKSQCTQNLNQSNWNTHSQSIATI